MRFSQRHGYTPAREVVQRESMDDALRVGLWNSLDVVVLQELRGEYLYDTADGQTLAFRVWHAFFKEPVDAIPEWGSDMVARIRRFFYAEAAWFDVYDLLEFVAQQHPSASARERLPIACNHVLEREMAAYRFVGGRIIETTSPEEIAAVEDGIAEARGGAQTHLRAALDLLADRNASDYRNVVKEAISAVEATVNELAGTEMSLGAALKQLGLDLHPAFRDALSKLYGYTSDADGIRHALTEDGTNVSFEDAKFMLVACAGFVSYLKAKAARANASAAA